MTFDHQIHPPSCPSLAGVAVILAHRRSTYPGIPLFAECLTLDKTPLPSDWWLPLVATSNLYHLPIAITAIQGHR
jgi:hypothetical protein